MSSEKRNVGVLAVCQALFNSANSIIAVTSALVGFQFLGDDKTLATVPVAAMVIGTALATVPASLIMRRLGRRPGFRLGSLVGVAGAAVASASFYYGGFLPKIFFVQKSPKDCDNEWEHLMEQSFLLKHYGHFSLIEQAYMTAEERNWYLERITKENQKQKASLYITKLKSLYCQKSLSDCYPIWPVIYHSWRRS